MTPMNAASDAVWPAYNVFRRKNRPDLCCAVPEDRMIPSFLAPQGWEFAGVVRTPSDAPLGFKERAARVGVRLSGFYLFQTHTGAAGLNSLAVTDAPS
jgi:hypothetical protein